MAPSTAAADPVAAEESTPPDLPPPWVEIDVRAVRMGGSIRFDITGTGYNHREGQEFEDPQLWQVDARAESGQTLQRLVNGSTRVSREPVGPVRHNLWDVSVTFSVAFMLPDDVMAVEVMVAAPGGEPQTITLRDLVDAERKPAPSKGSASPSGKRKKK